MKCTLTFLILLFFCVITGRALITPPEPTYPKAADWLFGFGFLFLVADIVSVIGWIWGWAA